MFSLSQKRTQQEKLHAFKSTTPVRKEELTGLEGTPPESEELIKVGLKVNDVDTEALVDTGASTDFIDKKFVETNNIQIDDHLTVYLTLAMKSPDNKLTQERLGVVTLKVAIGNLIENRKFIVVDLQKYTIILGVQFCRDHNIQFDWKTKKVKNFSEKQTLNHVQSNNKNKTIHTRNRL